MCISGAVEDSWTGSIASPLRMSLHGQLDIICLEQAWLILAVLTLPFKLEKVDALVVSLVYMELFSPSFTIAAGAASQRASFAVSQHWRCSLAVAPLQLLHSHVYYWG